MTCLQWAKDLCFTQVPPALSRNYRTKAQIVGFLVLLVPSMPLVCVHYFYRVLTCVCLRLGFQILL